MMPIRSGGRLSVIVAQPQAVPSCVAAVMAAAHAHTQGVLLMVLLAMLAAPAAHNLAGGQPML